MVTDKEITAFIKKRSINLKGLRRKLKISQQELHRRSGISQKSISEIENGLHDYKIGTYFKYVKSLRNGKY
jgi:transcriptional regulator with XRE-family HTH domain